MKKSDNDDQLIIKNEHKNENGIDQKPLHIEEEGLQCAEIRELRKDKKYINKLDQILCYHDKTQPLHVLIVVTFREKDCVLHVPEVYQ